MRRGWILLGAILVAGGVAWCFVPDGPASLQSVSSSLPDSGPDGERIAKVAIFRDGGTVGWGVLAIAAGLVAIAVGLRGGPPSAQRGPSARGECVGDP